MCDSFTCTLKKSEHLPRPSKLCITHGAVCACTLMVSLFIQIPTILRSLQASIQAILMGSLTETDWIQKGVLHTSLTDSWPLGQPVSDGSDVAIATDSSYLYAHGPFGLLKVGLGYGNTTKVTYVYMHTCVHVHMYTCIHVHVHMYGGALTLMSAGLLLFT